MKRFTWIVVLAGCTGAHREHPTADAAPPDATTGLVPSNVADFGGIEETGLRIGPPDGTFDTDAECVATSTLGTCTVVTRTDLPQACVCRADEITIGTLKITGTRALVLLAKRHVIVKTLLDVSGDPGVDGPGATLHYAGAIQQSGAPGGSFATKGAGGGGEPAPIYGEPALVPLLGGMSGMRGGNEGGGGGGALQITAGEHVDVQGVINAGGGGGRGGAAVFTMCGGAGGGSGGGILIEAPAVIVSGTIVAGGGGGGGGGGTNGAGAAGRGGGDEIDLVAPARGGGGRDGAGCAIQGYVQGGDGGRGAAGTDALPGMIGEYNNVCSGPISFVGSGGSGGGVGRIRINTATGCQCGGSKIAPSATFGVLPL